jgi:hypothetical protein
VLPNQRYRTLLRDAAAPRALFSNVKTLLPMTGADGAITITDVGSSPKTWTRVGTAQVDTAQSKFGGSSCLFDGTGDYWTTPDHADWRLNTLREWTLDAHIRMASAKAQTILAKRSASGNQDGWSMGISAAFTPTFTAWGGGDGSVSVFLSGTDSDFGVPAANVLAINTWYHIRVCRFESDYWLYLDGRVIGHVLASSTPEEDTSGVRLGADLTAARDFNGWIDNVRVAHVAMNTGVAFTAPTAAYPTA